MLDSNVSISCVINFQFVISMIQRLLFQAVLKIPRLLFLYRSCNENIIEAT